MSTPATDPRSDVWPPVTAAERARCIATALACWVSAVALVLAWIVPMRLEEGIWIKLGVGLVVAEFIVIHAGTLLGELNARRVGWPSLLMLCGIYALFAAGIAAAFGSAAIALMFVLLLGGRLYGALQPPTPREIAYGRRRSIASAMLYLVLGFASVAVPLPELGVTPELVDAVWPDRGDGLWEAEPQRALAMGAAYFALLGWVESRPPDRAWVSN